jgi:hypothetical protein
MAMRKKNILIALVVLFICCNVAVATETVSNQVCKSLMLLRAENNEDAVAIDLTTSGDFASKPVSAIQVPMLPLSQQTQVKNLVFYFCGGAAADKTFGFKIYGWRNNGGMAELIAEGTGTLGTQAVVKYPHNGAAATNKFWADTLAISAQGTPETFQVADASGGNRCAKLFGYNCGYEWLYCEISSADGTTGAEAGNITVYWSYFN